ncbi:MAG: stage II sporulation protein M [Candidatus Krumholzibacteria bacterium]|nr:stage II sporulation protein M [Candidatus Krumholzibacteria bacterium]
MKEFQLKSLEFRREREEDWQELERLIDVAEKKGLDRMEARDVSRLPVYYRAALSSLSVARAISLDANLLHYLENLSNRAFIRVYGVRHHLGEAFLVFLTRRFPQEVRKFRWLIALSAVFFLLGMSVGFVRVYQDPDNFYNMVDVSYSQGRNPAATTEELRGFLFEEESTVMGALTHFTSFLFTHNAQIGILSFALGFAVGLPVFYLMFVNGQILGAFAALYHQHGLSVEFWGWILPHGVTEIGAIVLCGGAGLVLARALVFPKAVSRLQNLAAEGKRAGIMVLGCVMMLAIAALIEGFFRQMVNDTGVRYAVMSVTIVLWVWFFTRAGREPAE